MHTHTNLQEHIYIFMPIHAHIYKLNTHTSTYSHTSRNTECALTCTHKMWTHEQMHTFTYIFANICTHIHIIANAHINTCT